MTPTEEKLIKFRVHYLLTIINTALLTYESDFNDELLLSEAIKRKGPAIRNILQKIQVLLG